jgi:hypothetical protein
VPVRYRKPAKVASHFFFFGKIVKLFFYSYGVATDGDASVEGEKKISGLNKFLLALTSLGLQQGEHISPRPTP